jgi:hypothetical protein
MSSRISVGGSENFGKVAVELEMGGILDNELEYESIESFPGSFEWIRKGTGRC